MNSVLKRIRTVWLAAAAIGATGLGGLVLAAVLIADGSPAGTIAVVLLTLGQVSFAFTVFLILRREHEVGQAGLRTTKSLLKHVKAPAELDATAIEELLEGQRRQIVADVDSRIVGLYETILERDER